MSINIEDILLLKARQDALNREDKGAAITAGAIGGSLAGVGLGHLHERLIPDTQMRITQSKFKPGSRMAGGLVGAVLGGALGAGTKAMMTQGSPAASLLAKIQTDGELTPAEARQLKEVLTATYNDIAS